MSFVFRPLLAAAAVAFALPAFAQVATPDSPTVAPAVTTTAVAPMAKPSTPATVQTGAAPEVKTPEVKTPAAPDAVKSTAAVKTDAKAKDTMSKSDTKEKTAVKGKVSANHHHKAAKTAG